MEKYKLAGKSCLWYLWTLKKLLIEYYGKLFGGYFEEKRVLERKVQTLMKLHERATTPVRMENNRSDKFTVNVGVNQASALSPLLFAVVMDKVIKDVREGVAREFWYTIDLVLLGDS